MNVNHEVLKFWNIKDVKELKKIQDNVYRVNCEDGTSFILKNKSNKKRVLAETHFIQHLKKKGVPVSVPRLSDKGECFVEYEGECLSLYKALEGEHIIYNLKKDDRNIIFQHSNVLAQIHLALADYKGDNETIRDMKFDKQIYDWALPTLLKHYDDASIQEKLNQLREEVVYYFTNVPKQHIHRDPHGGNILFENGEWSGLIDFDLATIGYRIFDICYMLLSFFYEDFREEGLQNVWLEAVRGFTGSYEEKSPLLPIEKESAWYFFICIELICAAYFIDIKDYKSADDALDLFNWLYNNKVRINSCFICVDS
ncbi:phosphotransferase enzyme family protein [Vallitalea okinawensis]|uniref:phosphotransferase enzyme family protein n=1 Tax=Vallitalea okinawensis TaxID=2078660 RepID=UPI00147871CF|nr:phosphotransferase [Vallitalea okinawensis]